MKEPKTRISIDAIVLFLALITPAMPKIEIMDGVYMYFMEIFLLFLFPMYICKIKLKFQIYLFVLWIAILLSTLLSFIKLFDFGGLMRVIKGIIYLPLGYIAYKKFKPEHLIFFLKVFTVASIFNILLLLYNINLYGFNIWDVKTISSGLSNRYISIHPFEIGTIENGSHGIWGNYCVLALAINLFLKLKLKVNNLFFLLINILVLLGIGLSVSREATVTLLFVIIGLIYFSVSIKRLEFNKRIFNWIIFSALFIFISISFFGDQLPILQKILYTVDSIESSGSEGNIQLRINGWVVFFQSLLRNPEKIFLGYGFNLKNYESFLTFVHHSDNFEFVALPESFFIMALCFGGIVAFVCSIFFFNEIFKNLFNIKDKILKCLLVSYFLGLLFGNIFSGASIIADMLYAQVLLLIGFIISHKNYEFASNYNQV